MSKQGCSRYRLLGPRLCFVVLRWSQPSAFCDRSSFRHGSYSTCPRRSCFHSYRRFAATNGDGSTSRIPNLEEPPISKHVTGEAVDVGYYWSVPNARRWDQAIDDIARRFNLLRPFHNYILEYADVRIDEPWHYERP